MLLPCAVGLLVMNQRLNQHFTKGRWLLYTFDLMALTRQHLSSLSEEANSISMPKTCYCVMQASTRRKPYQYHQQRQFMRVPKRQLQQTLIVRIGQRRIFTQSLYQRMSLSSRFYRKTEKIFWKGSDMVLRPHMTP